MQPKIRFIGDYPKLHGQHEAKLLHARLIRVPDEMTEELLAYDTTRSDGTRFELKKGEYVQLVFLGEKGIPFCTIRQNTKPFQNGAADKMAYYESKIGEVFSVEIKEKDDDKS